MRRCRECGFPHRISRFLEWHSDGTLIGSVRPKIPLMFLEVAEVDYIFEELESAIGLPIEHIIIEAQKYIGKDLVDMVKGIYWNIDPKRFPMNRLFRPQWLGKALVAGMRRDLSGLGAGRVTVESYRVGRELVLRFENPCLVPLTVGNCLGIYESVEDMPGSRADYGIEGGALVIRMTHAEEKPESEERLYLEEVEAGAGPLKYDRCPRCGVPLRSARSTCWELDRGAIMNPLTGQREGMIAVQSVNAIMRELERELGGEVPGIIFDAQKRYQAGRLEKEGIEVPREFWESYLTGMALRGLGYPEHFEAGDDSVTIDARNAYNQDLYAAKIAAGLERVTGRASSVKWDTRDRHHGKYTVTAE